ncbi:hypothetical protein E7Z59_06240 [Robertkochia marina]|uniref:Uncharacterized protein n=1 Tax=Robertkochia marina TaxID=1227945 RepID=A0A4S3M695_9FLAO|nr:hypothetical protein [Robertkochia marina]THD69921.1 hypothetical protein E7Z59_06240 [Robertkochia marina]
MRNILCLLVFMMFLLPVQNISCQTPGTTADLFQLSEELGNLIRQVDHENAVDNDLKVAGSRYADDRFKESVLYLGGKEIPGVYARFDALNGVMEIKINISDSENEVYVVKKDPEIRCKIGDDLYVYSEYSSDEGRQNGYLLALVTDGDYRLFKKQWVYFREGRDSGDPLKGSVPNRFILKEEVLVGVNRELPKLVKMRRNKVLEMLPEQEVAAARSFLSEKGYDLKEEAELVTFFQALNAGF